MMKNPFEISDKIKSLNERLRELQDKKNQIIWELIGKSDRREEVLTINKEKEKIKKQLEVLIDQWSPSYRQWLLDEEKNGKHH